MKALYGDTELPLKVMQSAAGYYIGREAKDPDLGYIMPYARDSAEYYATFAEADKALRAGSFTLREEP